MHSRPARSHRGCRTPIIGDVGYPDLTLCRDGRLIFAELKAERGRLSDEQARWLQDLAATRAEVVVWRPSDWLEGAMEGRLR